jgi:hypothetical protein
VAWIYADGSDRELPLRVGIAGPGAASTHGPFNCECVQQRDGVLEAVDREVALVKVDHREARSHESRDGEWRAPHGGAIAEDQQQSQLSPRQLSAPSFAATAAITSAAAGSAHHQASSAFASRPMSSATDR